MVHLCWASVVDGEPILKGTMGTMASLHRMGKSSPRQDMTQTISRGLIQGETPHWWRAKHRESAITTQQQM